MGGREEQSCKVWKRQRKLLLQSFGLLILQNNMERYEIVKDIGSGNFGVARLVRDKWTRELFAVKFIVRGQKVNSYLFFFFWEYSNWIVFFSSGIGDLLFYLNLGFVGLRILFLGFFRLMNTCKGKS